jgi:hypothetical protein
MKTRRITIRARADLQQELLEVARRWDEGAKGQSIRGDYFRVEVNICPPYQKWN